MISISNLILESFDVYSLPEMNSKGMEYTIKEENKANFLADFGIKGVKYFLEVKKNRGPIVGTHFVTFGNYAGGFQYSKYKKLN